MEKLYDPHAPIRSDHDPYPEDSMVFPITAHANPFWVNEKDDPHSVWAWWEGRYRLLDLDT